MKRIPIYLLLIIGLIGQLRSQMPENYSPFVRLGFLAVMEVYRPVIENGQLVSLGEPLKKEYIPIETVGSGTIISSDGLILTNYHVFERDAVLHKQYDPDKNLLALVRPAGDEMLVYMLPGNDPLEEPVFKYVAALVAYDDKLDVCLLKIVADNKGNVIEQVNLNYVKLANPYAIPPLATLYMFGYPGKGGLTLTITEGKFLGYTKDVTYKGVKMALDGSIKTDAPIAGGNSGGAALYNKQLIGIPTRGSSKEQKGSDFNYLHPIVWAAKPFAISELRYGIQPPAINREWFNSKFNYQKVGLSKTYVGGRVFSAQTGKPVEDALVVAFRPDIGAQQALDLIKELKVMSLAYIVQKAVSQGISLEAIAEKLDLPLSVVQKLAYMKIEPSPLLQQVIDGKFVLDFATTKGDGFYLLEVPFNGEYHVLVVEENFRPFKARFTTDSSLTLRLKSIRLMQY